MPKIFTIGFSGKSPDAFMDVLNAVRVRAVWDIRLWRTSTYVPFYSGDSLSAALGERYLGKYNDIVEIPKIQQ